MMFVGAALPLHSDGLAAAAAHVGADPAMLWSVVTVETSGCGFLPDRRPSILFERHVFRTRTGRRFDAAHPGISGPPGGYGKPGAPQYERLAEAIGCDRQAALESASWGLGQVMGFNAAAAEFRDAEEMVAQMMCGESEQLLGMADFLRASGMHTALQRRDWADFARRYNGPAFARNRYHEKLAAAHADLASKGMPNLEVRAVQLLLTYHGFNPGKVDGVMGGLTQTAIVDFTSRHEFPASGDPGELRAALLERLPPVPNGPGALVSSGPAPPDLRIVQSLLEHLGRSPGPVDGRPGPRTRNAIGGFQRSHRVAASGNSDAELFAALAGAVRQGFGRDLAADTRLVQRLLAIRGFDPGTIDGLIGPNTRAAIAAFARARGEALAVAIDNRLLDALLAAKP